jgi:hypothetical protein
VETDVTALDALLDQLPGRDAAGPTVTFGEVTATAPLTVRFNGTAAADAVQGVQPAGYTPAVGDTAVLLKVGSTWLAIGAVGDSGDTDWSYPTLGGNWVNYTGGLATGSGTTSWQHARYRKLASGLVEVQGLIKGGDVNVYSTLWTMPPGYRPGGDLIWSVPTSELNAASVCRAQVVDTGAVVINSPVNGWVSLSPIVYCAEQ